MCFYHLLCSTTLHQSYRAWLPHLHTCEPWNVVCVNLFIHEIRKVAADTPHVVLVLAQPFVCAASCQARGLLNPG